uniref:Uncharacterized protein n=1 Tax=viral metagenome TaxID=1070528 RepID=A0A6M3KUA1_9ZZZZ
MANELKHMSTACAGGTAIAQTDWEDVDIHRFESQATGDILYASSPTQLSRLAKGAATTVLVMGASIPAWSAIIARITSGTYTGNDTANRAIAHGLGAVPKLVFIRNETDFSWIHFLAGTTGFITFITDASTDALPETAPDATNFYVGNATNYSQSANKNTQSYQWVAIY